MNKSASYKPLGSTDCLFLGDKEGQPCWGGVDPVDEIPDGDTHNWIYACKGHEHTWDRRSLCDKSAPDYTPEPPPVEPPALPAKTVKSITIYHVLAKSTGEQRFEDEDGDKARGRAMEFAVPLLDLHGDPVTIWRTFELREK